MMPLQTPPYGVPLLDQIHTYFPDLLYNNQRFASLPMLFEYVNNQMNLHFNIYNRMHSQYHIQNAVPAANSSASVNYPVHPSPITSSNGPTAYMDDDMLLNMLNPSSVQPTSMRSPIRPQHASASRLGARSILTQLDEDLNSLLPGLDNLYPISNIILRASTFTTSPPPRQGIPRDNLNQYIRAETYEPPTPTDLSNQPICPICYSTFRENNICSIIACNHRFHPNRIQRWFENNHTCPMCRYDLLAASTNNQMNDN